MGRASSPGQRVSRMGTRRHRVMSVMGNTVTTLYQDREARRCWSLHIHTGRGLLQTRPLCAPETI